MRGNGGTGQVPPEALPVQYGGEVDMTPVWAHWVEGRLQEEALEARGATS